MSEHCVRCGHPADWHRLDDSTNVSPTDTDAEFRCLGYDCTAPGSVPPGGRSCWCPDMVRPESRGVCVEPNCPTCSPPARIPEKYRTVRRTIGGLKPGQSGWCVSWAVRIDDDWGCWIDPRFEVHCRPGGTVDTVVSRTVGGWAVSLPHKTEGWSPGRFDDASLIPATSVDVLPPGSLG